MKKALLMIRGAAALTAALVIIGSHGAVAAPAEPALGFYPASGRTCLVKFRSDAAGQANSALQGNLRTMEKDWVVLTTEKGDVYIPMQAVLLVQANPK